MSDGMTDNEMYYGVWRLALTAAVKIAVILGVTVTIIEALQ